MPSTSSSYHIPPISPLQLIVELSFIILAAFFATSGFINFDPKMRLVGTEMEYTTANHYFAAETLRTLGYIPLWQPFTGTGEPLIDGWTSDVLNPFAIGPSYLLGGSNGLKLGVVVAVLVAGLGGWALGRVLGFGSLARVVLALLCLGKGNLYSMLTVGGYYQFVIDEVFFPWIATGIVSLFWLPHRRWPIVLTALSITLLFFSGMVWFMLPTLFVLGVVSFAHIFNLQIFRLSENSAPLRKIAHFIDFVGLRRLLYAAGLTLLLSAATLLPLVVNYNNLPKQKMLNDSFLDLGTSIDQFLTSDLGKHTELYEVVRIEAFNFTLPVWFGVVLLALTVPLIVFYRQAPPKLWRIYVVGWIIVIFFVLWTAGLNPVVQWLDSISPIFVQFKHQWRMLAVAAFWLSVLIAMHVNGLWVTFARSDAWQARLKTIRLRFLPASLVRRLLAVLLIMISGYASLQVVSGWRTIAPVENQANLEGPCITWLRNANPTGVLSIWTGGHVAVWDYLNNQVRHWSVETDYFPVTPLTPTLLTGYSLIQSPPPYALVYGGQLNYALALGFKNDAPDVLDSSNHCYQGMVMHHPDTFSYASMVPLNVFQTATTTVPVEATTSVDASNYRKGADYIALVVDSDPTQSLVVTLQETAYPGWQVQVNGQSAKLESVGGQLGVILPPGQGRNQILFQYLPPLWLLGSKLTLLGCLLCIAFLLRAERLVPRVIVNRVGRMRPIVTQRLGKAWQKTVTALVNEHAFDPKDMVRPVASLPLLSSGAPKEFAAPDPAIDIVITVDLADEPTDPSEPV